MVRIDLTVSIKLRLISGDGVRSEPLDAVTLKLNVLDVLDRKIGMCLTRFLRAPAYPGAKDTFAVRSKRVRDDEDCV